MKTIINSLKRTIWFKASVSLLACLMFLMLHSCQKEELNQDPILNMDGLSPSTLTKKDKISYGKVKDIEGNAYKTVKIGKQWWMAENLAYLPAVSPASVGSKSEEDPDPYYYVWGYNGTDVAEAKASENYKTYGVLYNWQAAMAACPKGWHLPSNAEWTVLSDYLIENGYGYEGSGDDIARSLAAQTNWEFSSIPGTPGYDLLSNNSSGFSMLPGGQRTWDDFTFTNIGGAGFWYSSSGEGRYMESFTDVFISHNFSHIHGMSVRCIKGE